MKTRAFVVAGFAVAAVVAVSAFAARNVVGEAEPSRAPGGEHTAARAADAPRVRTTTVSAAPKTVVERFSGQVRSADRSAVGFTLSGRLEEVFVETGTRVSRGTIIARLDTEPFENALAEAAAQLEDVSSQLEQSRRDLERARALGQGTTAAELEQRRTAVERLEAQKRRARAAVSEAERRLDEATLRAPYAGEVVRRFVDRGEVLSAGSPVVMLSGAEGFLEIELALPEGVAGGLSVGTEALVSFPLSPEIPTVPATVTSRADHAAEGRGLFEATVTLAREAAATGVRPGMTGEVSLPRPVSSSLRAVDPAALTTQPDGRTTVYAVSDGVVSTRRVELRGVHDADVLVAGDLAVGEEVVVSGHYALGDGLAVEVAR